MRNIVISLFGSSIMEAKHGGGAPGLRWYTILQRALSDRFPLVCFPIHNAAIGGESTRECMARFERDVVAVNPDFCLVMMGANNQDYTRPQRILAEGEFEALMERFAVGLPSKTRPIGVVLNPVINRWHFATYHPAFQAQLKKYGGLHEALEPERQSFRAFMRSRGWPSLDLCEAFGADAEKYTMAEDGIHLNAAGQRLFGERMFALMEPLVAAMVG